ncbi:hypothetical protein [Variovorax sp. OV329]|uniref:DUF7281 domain-containing protein n=1 Tax=Variovorax sp. OV329 TaxID=1882825 RepID=UPI0008F391A9|nr:hypothetical protein [Variovorax sp. OV329]SFM91633.1 hypothetical protein SAMN05444747_1119 [Variovorax sp. OV329]
MTFSTPEILYLQRLVHAGPGRRRAGDAARLFCEHFSLGTLIGSWIEYRADHIESARQLLRANDLPITPMSSDASRADVAAFGGLSEKALSTAPHANSVAIRCIGHCSLDGAPLHTPQGTYLVVKGDVAARIACQRLMLVENLETFRELELYRWIDYEGLSVLVIYRGDGHLTPSAPRGCILGRQEPIWVFVDFDPAGLVIANGLPSDRVQRLVLPDMAWLAEAATTSVGRALYAAQESKARGTLGKASNPEIARAWREVQRLEGAVTQERMRWAPVPPHHSQLLPSGRLGQ